MITKRDVILRGSCFCKKYSIPSVQLLLISDTYIPIPDTVWFSYRYFLCTIRHDYFSFQTPIYLSLTLCGLATGIFCVPYMMVHFYRQRISHFEEKAQLDTDIQKLKQEVGRMYYKTTSKTTSPTSTIGQSNNNMTTSGTTTTQTYTTMFGKKSNLTYLRSEK